MSNSEEPIVISPYGEDAGEQIVVDMAAQKVLISDKGHKHKFEAEAEQDPLTPHLTYVKCKCGVGAIMKTGDFFVEKDILNADGTIQWRKSPLTDKEKKTDVNKLGKK